MTGKTGSKTKMAMSFRKALSEGAWNYWIDFCPPEIASAYPEVEEFINAAVRYYVFEFSDYDGMANSGQYFGCGKNLYY